MMSNCGKKLGIASDPHAGHYSFLASECLTCASLPKKDLSRISIAEGPGSTLSQPRQSHLRLTIRPSQPYWCLARQIRSRFGKAAVHAEHMRFVKLHSAWYRFHLRRLAASGGMPGRRGTGAACQIWAWMPACRERAFLLCTCRKACSPAPFHWQPAVRDGERLGLSSVSLSPSIVFNAPRPSHKMESSAG
jgi:hypothetical protein